MRGLHNEAYSYISAFIRTYFFGLLKTTGGYLASHGGSNSSTDKVADTNARTDAHTCADTNARTDTSSAERQSR